MKTQSTPRVYNCKKCEAEQTDCLKYPFYWGNLCEKCSDEKCEIEAKERKKSGVTFVGWVQEDRRGVI